MSIKGAAASKPTRPLIPIMVSPTCMSRPMAYFFASSCSFWISETASDLVPFNPTNSPFLKSSSTLMGSFLLIGLDKQRLEG